MTGHCTSLRAELRGVEKSHPKWHAFLSDAGRCWAVTTRHYADGSGLTVDGATPEQLNRAIAAAERDLLRIGSAA